MKDDMRLIELVRSNKLLYDRSRDGYRNPEIKKAVWASIAEELGATTGELCSKRWTTLRERYSRECRRIDEEPGCIQSYVENRTLIDALDFVKDHIKPRKPRTSIYGHSAILPKREEPEIPLPPESPTMTSFSPLPFSTPWPQLDEFTSDKSMEDNAATTKATTEVEEPASPVNAKKRKTESIIDIEAEFREAINSYKSICEERKSYKSNEAVHAFGQMIVAKISAMGPEKQNKAMKVVTDMIMTIDSI